MARLTVIKYLKTHKHSALPLSLYFLFSFFILVNLYFDLILPIVANANAYFQAAIGGTFDNVFILFLDFIPLIFMVTIIYILLFSVFWFILSGNHTRNISLHMWKSSLGTLVYICASLLLFILFSSYIPLFFVYFFVALFFATASYFLYFGISKKILSFLTRFSIHSLWWIFSYILLLTSHFLFAVLLYVLLRVDPYETFWRYVLFAFLWVVHIFIAHGVLSTHAHHSHHFWKKKHHKIVWPKLKHMSLIALFFIMLHGFSMLADFLPFGASLNVTIYAVAVPLGAVLYSGHMIANETTH